MSNFNVNYNAGGTVDKVKKIIGLEEVDNVSNIENVNTIEEINKIRGFATKTQPYNTMMMEDIPAIEGEYEFEMTLPDTEVEIFAFTVTCSGYGEDDHYDLYFNDTLWFENWYCGEVKEGLFMGTSTYVYAAPASSKIKVVFKNDSGTSKKIWVGVRMLVDSLPNK